MKKFYNKNIGLTPKELATLRRLNTPQKVQDFVTAIPQNFEPDGDTCMSVRETLNKRRAHCIEGALVAALAFWINGKPPLLMDVKASSEDDDHVVALFRHNSYWGAISKGNHAYTRYRDPVYRTLRELTMSYFHEYYNPAGKKTLRSYSRPLDLSSYKPEMWIIGGGAWQIAKDIDTIKHFRLISRTQEKLLRPIESVERRVAKITVHRRQRSR
ncbi:MAG TPA: hypothetical protein VJJ02_02655 [Candidatus Paceibacterota bacterium]